MELRVIFYSRGYWGSFWREVLEWIRKDIKIRIFGDERKGKGGVEVILDNIVNYRI